jgi:transcriptional regulator with XRE-family HTH domain
MMPGEILSLKTWQRRRLYTVRAFANAAGVTTKTVIDIESGRRIPRPGTIKSMSTVLNVEPEQVEEFRRAMGLASAEENSDARFKTDV